MRCAQRILDRAEMAEHAHVEAAPVGRADETVARGVVADWMIERVFSRSDGGRAAIARGWSTTIRDAATSERSASGRRPRSR